MSKIEVKDITEKNKGWQVIVTVDQQSFNVKLNKDYYQKLTAAKVEPEELIKRSFEFLLQREPASAILSEFELSVINRYFPEYEETIQGQIAN